MNTDTDKDIDKLIKADSDLTRVEIKLNKQQIAWLSESALISGITYKSISDLIYKIVIASTHAPDRPILPPDSRGQGRKVGSKNKPKKSKSKLKKSVKKSTSVQLDLLKEV